MTQQTICHFNFVSLRKLFFITLDPSSFFLANILLDSAFLLEMMGVVVLLVLSGLISASEVAFFSLSEKTLSDCKESKVASERQIALIMNEHRKNLLATILIMNNTVNVGIVMLSTHMTWAYFGKDEGGFVVVFLTVATSSAIVFFGELLPKALAQRRNMPIAKFVSGPIMLFVTLIRPLAWFLINFSAVIEKLFKSEKNHGHISIQEINEVLDLTTEDSNANKKILKGIVNFGQKSVRQIMRSRMDMSVVSVSIDFQDLVASIREFGYSRTPVYDGNIDKIVGVLYAKDLLGFRDMGVNFNWQKLIRKNVLFIPETKKIDDLFHEFQVKHVHMAIVVDEYGGTSGLVTLEDIIEEIVGEINDEFDEDEEKLFTQNDDGDIYTFVGKISVNDFCDAIKVSLHKFDEVKGESETLGGLLLELFSKMPTKGDQISYENVDFEIEDADLTRIKSVKVRLNKD